MNYKKIYDSIIDKRKIEEPVGYVEVHHIVPRSLGGSDDKENLVKLSAREHFICHYLLAKIYPQDTLEWYKTNHAFMMMKCDNVCRDRYYNSRLYEALKGNFSSIMSFTQSGKRNSQYGTMWITNGIDNKKISKDSDIPKDWRRGRLNVHSDEEKENAQNRVLGTKRPCSDEAKIKLSEANKGKIVPIETRIKISNTLKQRKAPIA